MTYALPEDAAKALQAGVTLNGRKVIVSVADKKPRQRDNYKPKNKQDTGMELSALSVVECQIKQATKGILHCQARYLRLK